MGCVLQKCPISLMFIAKKKIYSHVIIYYPPPPPAVKPEWTIIVFLEVYQTICPLFVFQPFSLWFGKLISNFLCSFNNDALQIKNESTRLCQSIQNSSYLYSSVTCVYFYQLVLKIFNFFFYKITLVHLHTRMDQIWMKTWWRNQF